MTHDKICELISYDPSTGIFTNLVSRGPRKIGTRAGTKSGPYRYITINGFKRAEHQWAFLYMLGRFPTREVDHKNRNKLDNSWRNLRESNRHQNLANSTGWIKNKRLKGTYPLESGRFGARIYCRGVQHRLGTFRTERAAHRAYLKKSRELHGEFSI